MRSRKVAAWISVAVVLVLASPADANTGLPMIVVMWPLMILALLPIIAIEAYVLSTRLAMAIGGATTVSAWANGVSTIVGMPITWVLSLLFPVMDAWILRFDEEYSVGPELVFPISVLGLLIPLFFASWLVEWRIAVWRLPGLDAGTVSAAIFVSNAITYACLAVFILAYSSGCFEVSSDQVR